MTDPTKPFPALGEPRIADSMDLKFNTRASKFNGLTLTVTKKEDSILIRFDPDASPTQNRQAVGLLDQLGNVPHFKVTAAIDVPDTHYHAADVTDGERDSSIFVLPAPGVDTQRAYVSLLASLQKLKATAPPSIHNTGFTLS